MKRVLCADFFEFRKSKAVFLLPLISVLLGFFLPVMYFGIMEFFKFLMNLDILKNDPSMTSLSALVETLSGKAVFLSVLPLSQGVGLVIAAMIGFRAARPFGTGIYRNKIISEAPRSAIYLSQTLFGLILAMVSAALYTVTAALTSRLTFGKLDLSGREIGVIAALTFGIYLVYTAIPVFTAFLSRSVPLTLVVSILLPVLTQTLVSFAAPALISAPDWVAHLLTVFPAFQNAFLMGAKAEGSVLAVSLSADAVWFALFTVSGILVFKKADLK